MRQSLAQRAPRLGIGQDETNSAFHSSVPHFSADNHIRTPWKRTRRQELTWAQRTPRDAHLVKASGKRLITGILAAQADVAGTGKAHGGCEDVTSFHRFLSAPLIVEPMLWRWVVKWTVFLLLCVLVA